jgi:membrane-associated phospholipid phosphatase
MQNKRQVVFVWVMIFLLSFINVFTQENNNGGVIYSNGGTEVTNYDRFRTNHPYKYSTTQESLYLSTGLAAFVGGYLLQNTIQPVKYDEIYNLNKNNINSFDRFATNNGCQTLANISDYALATLFVSPTLLLLDKDIRKDALSTIVLYTETMLYAGAIPLYVKKFVPRFRPYTYNSRLSLGTRLSADARTSFFSGHTTTAFASAVFLAKVYSDYNPQSKYTPYIWVGTLASASFIAYLRVASGYHFPTDVITSAAVGSAIGYLIPYLHQKEKERNSSNLGESKNFDYSFIPYCTENQLGLSMQMNF